MSANASHHIFRNLTLLLLIMLTSGCAKTYQARWAEPSGFLDDYSMLSDGESGDAILSYWDKNVDWTRYNKIIFEPIISWTGPESQLNELSHGERYRLKELLEYQMREALKRDFRLVRKPSPETIRVELAITEAETSIILLDAFSTIYPSARALSELKMLAMGTESYVGSAGYEGRITDSMTGQLLMASVDRRAGSKTLEGAFDGWDDVEAAYRHWVQQFSYQLCQKRQLPNCLEPD